MSGDTMTNSVDEMIVERSWRDASVLQVRPLVPGVHEVILDVPSWPGHRAGQHVDVRTSRADAWRKTRSYSIANAPSIRPELATHVHLAMQGFTDDDPARALADPALDYAVQVDGPKGERMAWSPEQTGRHPLLLIGGGTGIVPLMAIADAWAAADPLSDLKVLYSVRSLQSQLFTEQLTRLDQHRHAEVATIVTGDGPGPLRERRGAGRLSALDLELFGWPPDAEPECFVCGPVPFVESVTRMLVQTKHSAARIRTEWLVLMEEE